MSAASLIRSSQVGGLSDRGLAPERSPNGARCVGVAARRAFDALLTGQWCSTSLPEVMVRSGCGTSRRLRSCWDLWRGEERRVQRCPAIISMIAGQPPGRDLRSAERLDGATHAFEAMFRRMQKRCRVVVDIGRCARALRAVLQSLIYRNLQRRTESSPKNSMNGSPRSGAHREPAGAKRTEVGRAGRGRREAAKARGQLQEVVRRLCVERAVAVNGVHSICPGGDPDDPDQLSGGNVRRC